MNGPPTAHHELNPRWCLAHDTIDCRDIDHLIQWLSTYPRLTKGAITRDFESRWSSWLARSHSVYCNSGYSANVLMYYALLASGRLRNKKVIVPSVGWITSIVPAIRLGCESMGISGQVFQDLLYDNRTSECLEIVASQAKSSIGAEEMDLQAMVDTL